MTANNEHDAGGEEPRHEWTTARALKAMQAVESLQPAQRIIGEAIVDAANHGRDFDPIEWADFPDEMALQAYAARTEAERGDTQGAIESLKTLILSALVQLTNVLPPTDDDQ